MPRSAFVVDPVASVTLRRHAVAPDPRMVSEARSRGFAGWQIDFEQVPWTDKDLLTRWSRIVRRPSIPQG